MSYYEKRIAELEARVEQLALHQRMKAIPVEAQLIDSIAELKAENERLRKAGDALAEKAKLAGCNECFGMFNALEDALDSWNAAKEVQP